MGFSSRGMSPFVQSGGAVLVESFADALWLAVTFHRALQEIQHSLAITGCVTKASRTSPS